ncbi:VaFE repeat-containing surface-anchored protein [Corynebacterium ulcerans]|uniref:VaFE repeat-containing surface-anchored protein n=1 Tax=Corynebacterium ulcerans TaxID=65058 RepID=UPI0018D79384|nr:VaFE repeat-containing surface-anchored protein [Corynebacterium ulcerans]MBH5301529.1 VaFE repeat-containing surface-anchored protein [Corynebacterium ulcerans]
MKKNTLKRVAALITGIALSFTSSISAGAVENDEPYLGYVDSRVAIQNPYGNGVHQFSPVPPLVVQPESATEEETELAYCFNMNSVPPMRKDAQPSDSANYYNSGVDLRYKANFDTSLKKFAHRWREGSDPDAGVLKAIYNGYSRDAAGLKAALNLTDNEFRYATQLAVWYWSDSDWGNYLYKATSGHQQINQAFKILTGQAESPVVLKDVDPKQATLAIYTPYSNKTQESLRFQNLLSVKFVNPQDGTPVEPEVSPEPKLKTTALDKLDQNNTLAAEGGTIVDTVEYTGLTPGEEYVLRGELMDKDTKESTGIKAEKTFTAEAADGSVDVTFDVDGKFAGKTLVVFEKLFKKNDEQTVVAKHEDYDAESQTVTVEEDEPLVEKPSGFPWWILLPLGGLGIVAAALGLSSNGSSAKNTAEPARFNATPQGPAKPAEAEKTEAPVANVNKTEKKVLAQTGANVWVLTILAAVLIAVGAVLTVRRKQN